MKDLLKRILRVVALVGPGLFCLGFTIGTGSVTSMVKSGSMYGTDLLWVLAISAFFTWVMTEAYGRFGVMTGDTAIHGIKTRLKGGKVWAIILIIGLVVSQWISLSSILNITSNENINRVEVFNMMGRMVGAYDANDTYTQINTSSFANGVYTVKISTENGTSTKKFTVAR